MSKQWMFGALCAVIACGGTEKDDVSGDSMASIYGDGGAGGNGDASVADGAEDDGDEGDEGDDDSSGDAGMNVDCGPLHATIRDFKDDHPDFEKFSGSAAFPGIVATDLGTDGTPTYASAGATAQTSGPDAFAQWYHDVDGVNQAIGVDIMLNSQGNGLYEYNNPAFFPIDGMGFGNQGREHNYHFTTEVHTKFTYEGGEVFTFTGDDDLWLFVNGKLALDLGGLHPPVSQTVDFDAMAETLGIEPGKTYPMDIFHAERHTVESNFRIATTIKCFMPVL